MTPNGVRVWTARAKLNLYLHVVGKRPDGYHLLDSLVVFPDIGDRLSVAVADGLSLSVSGRFADAAGAGRENLVMRAARALQPFSKGAGAALCLEKHLPVAAGLGGGSCDAAATLLALRTLWALDLPADRLQSLALDLGADVPVCLAGSACRMEGVGEELTALPGLPTFSVVLVNSGDTVATGAVFSRLRMPGPRTARPPVAGETLDAFVAWLARQANDLDEAAVSVAPSIGTVMDALSGMPEVRLARMSGSGATCFGICATYDAAQAVAERLAADYPGWWIRAATVDADAGGVCQTTLATT